VSLSIDRSSESHSNEVLASSTVFYREYSCTMSSPKCTALIQGLALSGGSITSMHSTYREGLKVNYCTMFFILKFFRQENLDKFHSLGFETTKPEKIHLNKEVQL
jgi:hypothetical protein